MGESRATLRQRWKPGLVQTTTAGLLSGRVASPFGEVVSGQTKRIDLRGFPLTEVFRGICLSRVDLSDALVSSAGMIKEAVMVDCVLDRAELETNLMGTFDRCSFRRARMSDVEFGLKSRFSCCDFSEANLARARGHACEFVRCDFAGASLRGASLIDGLFEECIWMSVQFHHSSLGGSRISEAGFPKENGEERPLKDRRLSGITMPAVILDGVKWLA